MESPMVPWHNKKNIAIATHAFVDPDALGSMVALGSFLMKQKKDVTMAAYGGVPSNLRFLLGDCEVVSRVDDWEVFDMVIVLDSSNLDRPGFAELNQIDRRKLVNIDHHPDNTMFGSTNIVDSERSSASEIILDVLRSENFDLSAIEATALLAGMMGDTGSFKHSNTSARVYELAGELMLKGAALDQIARNLFAGKTVGQLRAWSYVLEHAHHDKKTGAIVSGITEQDLKSLDIDEEALEGVVDILNSFPDASYAAFMRQQGDEVKVSLRSESYKGTDVSSIASQFGGGGHLLAAGFAVPGHLVRGGSEFYIQPIKK